jgi:hypothetical protein
MSQVNQSQPFQAAGGQAFPVKPVPVKTNHLMRRAVSYALLALVFFVLGFLPTWVKLREANLRLSDTQHALSRAQIQNALGAAIIDVQWGDYEPARQSISTFYTSLQAEIGRGGASAFSPAEQAAMQPMFGGRDDVIALLAREDPAAARRLSDLYKSYSQILMGEAASGVEGDAMGAQESAAMKPAP